MSFRHHHHHKWWHFGAVFVHGQILSLCIVGTHVFSTQLAESGHSMPALQSFFNYTVLFLVFTPVTLYRMGGVGNLARLLRIDWYKFFFLALGDVLGNYFVVKAYTYTNLLSVELLDMWAILTVVMISIVFLKVRYSLSQFIGIAICFMGLLVVLLNDSTSQGNTTPSTTKFNLLWSWPVDDSIKGDFYVLLGATLYGISNTLEEAFVSQRPIYLVIGQMGFWGMLISGLQSGIVYFLMPRDNLINVGPIDAKIVGYFTGFTLVMFILYTTTPLLFRNSSATYYNMSILTSDFWGLLVGAKLFHFKVLWLYPLGFLFTILGMVVYYLGPEMWGIESANGEDDEINEIEK